MDTGGRIKEKRKEKGLTQAGLAALIGVDKSTVYRWEAGKQAPESGAAVSLAEALGTTSDYLLGKAPAPEKWSQGPGAEAGESMIKTDGCGIPGEEPSDPRSNVKPLVDSIQVPVISLRTRLCAGEGNGLAEADFEVLALRPVERRKLVGHEYSVETLRIMTLEGDSMEPKLHDGEDILFNRGEDVPHGGIAVVVWRWRWFVRGVLWGKDHSVTLRAANPNYQDIHIEAGDEEFHIIGRVIGGLGSFRATPSIF